MKNFISGVVLVLLVVFFVSCASITDVYRPLSQQPDAEVLGTLQVNFETMYVFMPGTYPGASKSWKRNVDQAAYNALLEAAKKEYSGNIDVYNITFEPIRYANRQNNMNEYRATGRVILLGGGSATTARRGVEGALERAANDVSKDFTPRSRIAIVQITAPDRSTRDYMIGELEYILQQQGYYMVDRAQLDRIFEEQRFGASSDVDDNTAARMGKIAGASIVITGRVDGEGNLRRLRLRALNTETAQVVGTASERL